MLDMRQKFPRQADIQTSERYARRRFYAVALDHPLNEQEDLINQPLVDAPPIVTAVHIPVENGLIHPPAHVEAGRRRRFGGCVWAAYRQVFVGLQQRAVQVRRFLHEGHKEGTDMKDVSSCKHCLQNHVWLVLLY